MQPCGMHVSAHQPLLRLAALVISYFPHTPMTSSTNLTPSNSCGERDSAYPSRVHLGRSSTQRLSTLLHCEQGRTAAAPCSQSHSSRSKPHCFSSPVPSATCDAEMCLQKMPHWVCSALCGVHKYCSLDPSRMPCGDSLSRSTRQ